MDNNKTLNINAIISSFDEEMSNQDLDFSDDEKSPVVDEGCGDSNDQFKVDMQDMLALV